MSTFFEFVSTPEALASVCRKYKSAHAYPIGQGFAVIPLTEDLWEEIDFSGVETAEEFPDQDVGVSHAMAEFAREISTVAPVAYVAGDYWDNKGWQVAVVWRQGELVLGPLALGRVSDRPAPKGNPTAPINQALRLLGVTAGPGRDEFDSVDIDHEPGDWFNRHVQSLDEIE